MFYSQIKFYLLVILKMEAKLDEINKKLDELLQLERKKQQKPMYIHPSIFHNEKERLKNQKIRQKIPFRFEADVIEDYSTSSSD